MTWRWWFESIDEREKNSSVAPCTLNVDLLWVLKQSQSIKANEANTLNKWCHRSLRNRRLRVILFLVIIFAYRICEAISWIIRFLVFVRIWSKDSRTKAESGRSSLRVERIGLLRVPSLLLGFLRWKFKTFGCLWFVIHEHKSSTLSSGYTTDRSFSKSLYKPWFRLSPIECFKSDFWSTLRSRR